MNTPDDADDRNARPPLTDIDHDDADRAFIEWHADRCSREAIQRFLEEADRRHRPLMHAIRHRAP